MSVMWKKINESQSEEHEAVARDVHETHAKAMRECSCGDPYAEGNTHKSMSQGGDGLYKQRPAAKAAGPGNRCDCIELNAAAESMATCKAVQDV